MTPHRKSMNLSSTNILAKLLLYWLSLSVSVSGVLQAAESRDSLLIDFSLRNARVDRANVIARTEASVLVKVGSLEGLRLESLDREPDGGEALARIEYQGIYRGQAIVLVSLEEGVAIPRRKGGIQVELTWQGEREESWVGRLRGEGAGFRKLTENSERVPLGSVAAAKIPITEFGLYEVPLSKLEGIFPGEQPKPEELALFFNGKPIPLEWLQSETEEGVVIDRLFFHGSGTFNDYTKTNIFWLTDQFSGPQMITSQRAEPDSSLETPKHFPTTIHAEEDLHIWQTMTRGEGQDHWFWGDKLTAPGSRDYTLSVPFPAQLEKTTHLRGKYHGLTFSSFHRPDHQVRLSLNGQFLGDHFWDDRNPSLQEVVLAHNLLKGGDNTVTVAMPGLPGVPVDQVFINWFEIDYDRLFVAENNRLLFHGVEPKRQTFEVTGLSDEKLDVLELGDIHHPVRMQDFEYVVGEGEGTLRFSASSHENAEFLVQGQSKRQEVPKLAFNEPSFWADPSNGADYIVITHEDFTVAAERLVAYRASQGLRAVTVQIQDIYDEFAYGEFGPQAIRDFLSFAYHHWEKPKPQFVVLFGDAYLDYHDNLKTGSINYVPSQQIHTELIGLTVSDNWFAQVDGDDKIPDLYLGRIPVRTDVEAERIVDRIIQYETSPEPGEWASRIALIADDDDGEFVELSEELASYVPSQLETTRWYTAEQGEVGGTGIVDLFQSGHSLITYTGHGTISSWGLSGSGSILMTSAIAAGINPKGRWPIVTVANCLNGFFAARHASACLAEVLLGSEHGGAIAVWAPTSLGFPAGHRILMNEFYREIFEKGEITLGAATTAAQIATFVQDEAWLELLETYVLFGDPAMRIQLNLPAIGHELTVGLAAGSDELHLEFAVNPNRDYTVYSVEGLDDPAAWRALDGAPHNSGRVSVSVEPQMPTRFFKVESVAKPVAPLPDGADNGATEDSAKL